MSILYSMSQNYLQLCYNLHKTCSQCQPELHGFPIVKTSHIQNKNWIWLDLGVYLCSHHYNVD